jgi:4-methyl-5(b-hydroxyethyl)-thiazole monophosphate biosynthesis
MVKDLLVVMYPGVADWEVGFPIFCLRPGIKHTFVTTGPERITTALGFEIVIRQRFEGLKASDFDGIYLPGGVDPVEGRFPRKLGENPQLIRALQESWQEGRVVAAICGAPLVLGAAGLLMGKRFASDITQDTRGWFDGATRARGPLVVDGNIITASVQAIIPFSVELARRLGKEDIARGIEEFFVR